MLKGKKVYVIEDEDDIAELVRYNLSLEGYHVTCFASGEDGLRALREGLPDIFILDIMLPGMSGLEVCRKLKVDPTTKDVPIIIVSAKGEEQDVIKGLELGADDYLAKPFSPKVLVARIRAVLRRWGSPESENEPEGIINTGEVLIHPGRFEVTVKGELINFTRSEFQILHFLAQKPGWVFTRSQIVDAIRGENYAVTDRSIDFQMVGLRKKLGEAGHRIETVRGVGYRFTEA